MTNRIQTLFAAASIGVVAGSLAGGEKARNPVIWADVPDVAVIRVDDTYYMSSTTMHMSPGLPIMKSKDLVNWSLIGYAYDTLGDNEALRLEDGKNAYGQGSWASSLRYHDGTYFVSTFSSTTGKTHVYTTKDIEEGDWKAASFEPSLHDHSLFFDDDGRVYMLYGGGDLRLVELEPDLSGIKEGGYNEVVIEDAHAVATDNIMLPAEGSQMIKVDGKYYVMNICWPRGGMRTQIVHRADKITGPYEGRVVLQDKGVAQGCLIDTPDGEWYAMLFQDNGAVGRSPWLVPVKWEDGWPVLGEEGEAPVVLNIPDNQHGLANIVASDEFDRKPGEPLPLAWQWNHNPDERYWSIGERQGHLRLTNGRVDSDVLQSRNTLTQRTFGPTSSATTKVDVSNLKDGNTAGFIALQKKYGFVGVRQEEGERSIVMESVQSGSPKVAESIPLDQKEVYLKIECDFRDRADEARFHYSLDGEQWRQIGDVLEMDYTLPHFMGYRFGLFTYATKETGGYADFDFYRVSGESSKPTYVIVHGAWAGGWEHKQLAEAMEKNGYTVHRVTLTGHGERSHLASPEVDLSLHIQDVVNFVEWEDLRDVVLVGHSYGGMVITGVVDRMPDRFRHVIYLDAFLPEDGESAYSARGGDQSSRRMPAVDGFIALGDQSKQAVPHIMPQSEKTFTEPIQLENQDAARTIPTTYILTVDPGKGPEDDMFYRYFERAKDRGWATEIMEGDHVVHLSQTQETARRLIAAP